MMQFTQILSTRKYPSFTFFLLCFILGAMGGSALLTPIWVKALLIPSVGGILWFTESLMSRRQMFRAMGAYFWGYFCVSLYWISVFVQVDLEHFWWLIPPTALGLPLVVAFVQALPFLIFSIPLPIAKRIGWFLLAWISGELLRSFLFTGLPWALAGHILADVPMLAQLASKGTAYSLSLFVLLIAVIPYVGRKSYGLGILILTLGLAAWGWNRMQTPLEHHNLRVRLVQPNIVQTLKWDPLEARRNLETLLTLSQDPFADIIVWPEAATPYLLAQDKGAQDYIAQRLPKGSLLIAGIVRSDGTGGYNSLIGMDTQGAVKGVYDKHHLVPFGEYIPFRSVVDSILPGRIHKITQGLRDTTPGKGPEVLHIGDLPPFLPQICYEAIFPLWLQKWNHGLKFDWMVVVTNDAWYGDTAGPYQHLNIARMRAIEYGVPVVRVANTGISALIDPYGRIIGSLPLNSQGRFDIKLPKPLKD